MKPPWFSRTEPQKNLAMPETHTPRNWKDRRRLYTNNDRHPYIDSTIPCCLICTIKLLIYTTVWCADTLGLTDMHGQCTHDHSHTWKHTHITYGLGSLNCAILPVGVAIVSLLKMSPVEMHSEPSQSIGTKLSDVLINAKGVELPSTAWQRRARIKASTQIQFHCFSYLAR